MNTFRDFLNYSFELNDKIHLDVQTVIFLFVILIITPSRG
mgnify:CR=1 FL=1